MNPNTPPPRDDELPDERELAALYARLPKAEPAPSLDDVVLAQAAAAVSRVTPVVARRRRRWPVALASAAVLVLAVSVAWQVREMRPLPEEHAPPAARPPVEAAPAPRKADHVRKAARPQASDASAALGYAPAEAVPAPVAASAPPAPPAPPSPPAPPAPPADIAPASVSLPPAPAALPQRARDSDLGPDDLVGEIRRLLNHGDRDDALRALRELRRRYPRYDVPQDLRELTP